MEQNTNKDSNKKIIGVQLDSNLYNALFDYAASIGGSLSSAIRFILIKYLDKEKKGKN